MVFEDSDLSRIGKAFDRAWDRFLLTGMLSPDNLSRSRELIAKRILDTAWLGERDEWRLARDALFNTWQLQFTGVPPLPVVGGTRRRRFRRHATPRTDVSQTSSRQS